METINETLDNRGEQYGKFKYHAEVSQRLKKVINTELEIRNKILEHDQHEALEMICHKIARIINGNENNIDSWHDIAGYSSLIAKRLSGETV